MGIEKAELKILIANNLGADIEDKLEGARRAAYQLEGAVEALKQASKHIPNQLCAKVDELVNDGTIKDSMSALEVGGLVKKYVTKCGDFLLHLSDVEQNKMLAQHGEIRGIMSVMAMVKKIMDTEAAKISALQTPSNGERAVGQHPGPSEASKRKDSQTAAGEARKEHGSLAERRVKGKAEKSKKDKPKKVEVVKKAKKTTKIAKKRGRKPKAELSLAPN